MISQFIKNKKVETALLLFLVLYILFIYIHPSFCFDKNGNLLQFGLNYSNKTIIPIWLIVIILSIFSYFMTYYYTHRIDIYY